MNRPRLLVLGLLFLIPSLGVAAAPRGAIVQPALPVAPPQPISLPVQEPAGVFRGSCPQQPLASQWTTEWIDAPRMFSDMRDDSLALDASGFPHIAYGQDHLYYASYDGVDWQIETVDPAAEVGIYASLELDGSGRPHIAYYDRGEDQLRYAAYDGATWQIQIVDPHDGMS